MLIGVLIVVVGVGMFLKLARDEGWIGAISPTMRCASMALFGTALIALGELLRRKINPLASSGFSAAGIATIFASILAATKMFALIDTPLAFILLFMVTTLGIGLGSLANRVMLSLLSLIAAFAVPILLATGEPSPVILPLYLLSLLTMGLTLSAWKGGHYSYVRQLAWWGTGIIGSMWLVNMHKDAPISALSFVTIAWIMTVAELAISARFFKSLRDRQPWPENSNAGFTKDNNAEIRFHPKSLFSPESRWINALFGATAWAAIAAGLTLYAIKPQYDFIAPLALSLLSILIVLAGSSTKINIIGKFWEGSTSPRSLFGSAMIINSALLIVATIAAALGGWIQVVAWLVAGLAAIETGRRIRFRAAELFGLILLAIATLRLLTIDLADSFNTTPAIEILGIALTQWTLQMLLATLALIVAHHRSRSNPERSVAICAAIWLTTIALFHNQTQAHALGSAWMLIAAFGCWIAAWIKNSPLRINSFIIAGIAMYIVLTAQIQSNGVLGYDINIHATSLIIAALAWAAIASTPGSGFLPRTAGAALATISILIAIGKLNTTMGTPEMYIVQALTLTTLIAIGKRLFPWSLNEIASALLLLLSFAWITHQIALGSAATASTPFLSPNSLAALTILIPLFWSGRTIQNRKQPHDAPKNLPSTRRSLAITSLGTFWLLLLIASTLEVVRSTQTLFDAGSARGASVSIWWSLYAITSVAGGFRFHKSLRWAGLSLMGIVAIKVLLIDTMTLAPPARVVAAITVGLIIIATGVLYTRLVNSSQTTPQTDPNPDPNTDTDTNTDTNDQDSETTNT